MPSTKERLVYIAAGHPEERLAGGKMLVTVCQGESGVLFDPSQYRPKFLEVDP